MTYCKYPNPFLYLFTITLTFFLCPIAHGKILFEGYSQIFSASKPAGYIVQRYEHNQTKKELISKYYIQTSSLLGQQTEVLLAKSTEDLKPLYYKYITTKNNRHMKTIEAHFKSNMMVGYIINGQHRREIKENIPPGAFLSTFLGYLMLNKGYKEGLSFNFLAIAEEDASLFNGESHIRESFTLNGVKVFKISNQFKGSHFISFINEQGEVLSSHSPLQKISTQLTNFKTATSPYFLDKKNLQDLFGNIPEGKINIYTKQFKTKDWKLSKKWVHQSYCFPPSCPPY